LLDVIISRQILFTDQQQRWNFFSSAELILNQIS
jgi:hypothetical protein